MKMWANRIIVFLLSFGLLYTNLAYSSPRPCPYKPHEPRFCPPKKVTPYACMPRPTAPNMVLDAAVGRPLLAALTIVGTGLFIVSLPFSLLGRNVGAAANQLVIAPANATINRCLGCPLNMAMTDWDARQLNTDDD